jgi:uncharacterized protein (DUF1697 family)
MTVHLALLRGINVTGRNMITMPELRTVCASIGWTDVQSYIQSGNLLFRAAEKRQALESALEHAIETRFGLTIPVIVRTASEWPDYLERNPFPAESEKEPNRVMLALSKKPPRRDAVDGLRERANDGERIAESRDAIWIHYAAGSGRSRLSPALLDRLIGSPVTSRNWNTVRKLGALSASLIA